MDTTHCLPRYDNCQNDLILQGNLHNQIGSGVRDAIKETSDAARDAMEASNRNGIAAIKETSDSARDNIRETSRVGHDLSKDISDARSESSRGDAEGRLQTAIISGEIRELVNTTAASNLIAIKDNGFSIREEGCKTREKICDTEHNLTKQIFSLEKETLKGFHQTQLEALKNKCDLEAKLAECCCELKALSLSENNATRALILSEGQKVLAAENSNLKLELLLKNNSKGNGNS
ncbi:MAG: hypothetical protein ACRC6O_13275 [Flavobacterium sp.]